MSTKATNHDTNHASRAEHGLLHQVSLGFFLTLGISFAATKTQKKGTLQRPNLGVLARQLNPASGIQNQTPEIAV
jgi:hypothetical protein